MMIKAIVFDLDGTLLDTSRDIRFVLNNSLAKFGLPPVSSGALRAMLGDGAYNLVSRAVPAGRRDLVQAVYEDYVPAYASHDNSRTVLYQGEDGALKRLKAAGVKLAVLSNKPQDATLACCRDKLGEYGFDMVVGQGRFPLKPDPSALYYMMDSLGVGKDECLFTGDGETDVKTAKNAGIPCVSVLWGFRKKQQLERVGANIFAENYTQYLQILQEKFSFKA